MTQDIWGDWYTADCHSKPISQIVRGGCYPSFGRPDDGLGFIPSTMEHSHGSTAIAGVVVGDGSNLPSDFQDNFFSGNVMTCRINRNRIERLGASVKAMELPDLLTSEDAWFRPVDLQVGSDGWIYIADFYNRVIGHYEVPLDHPGRDRFRGRIWRVGVKDAVQTNASTTSDRKDLGEAVALPLQQQADQLLPLFGSSNPTVRRLAMESLVQSSDQTNRDAILGKLDATLNNPQAKSIVRVNALWAFVQISNRLPSNLDSIIDSQDELLLSHLFAQHETSPTTQTNVRSSNRKQDC